MSKNIRKNNWANKFIYESFPNISFEYGNKKVITEEEIKKLYKLVNSSLSENDFFKVVNIIHKNGGKVKKNGLIKLNIKVIDKIIDEYKSTA